MRPKNRLIALLFNIQKYANYNVIITRSACMKLFVVLYNTAIPNKKHKLYKKETNE